MTNTIALLLSCASVTPIVGAMNIAPKERH
jgi:hypothetical protein